MTQSAHDVSRRLGLVAHARYLIRDRNFRGAAELASEIQTPMTRECVSLADEVAFALGRVKDYSAAIRLLEAAFELMPDHRRASNLAYLHYESLLALGASKGGPRNGSSGRLSHGEDRQGLRRGFRRWMARALELPGQHLKDYYRLGLFEAQIEAAHDKTALVAFAKAIEAWHALAPVDQAQRGDLRKYYVKTLYAAGRSAYRLELFARARSHAFACIREDREHDYLEAIHKFTLAGKVCLATGELDAAERAVRLALAAKGPSKRDWLYGLGADIEQRRGHLPEAVRWIEGNVPPLRRSPPLWRQLGTLREAMGDAAGALEAMRSALKHDKMGRHLTLVAMGNLLLGMGKVRDAEQAFREAIAFRRKNFLSDEPRAKDGLARCQKLRGPSIRKAERQPVESSAEDLERARVS